MIPFESAFVVGSLASGLYSALYLRAHGVRVFVSESKPFGSDEKFGEAVRLLDGAGIPHEFGGNSASIMAQYDALIVSPGVPPDAPILVAARSLGKPVIGETEVAAFADIPVLAVTGSNGKSTTTALLGVLVSSQYHDTVTGGNLGSPVSQLLVEHPSAGRAVLEVSCFQLETIHTFHPRVAVFTNLVPNHLDRYGTMERYFATKQRIFENMTGEDFAVLNRDDPALRGLASALAARTYWFGFTDGPFDGVHIVGHKVVFRDSSQEVELFDTGDLRIPGRHNVANAMSAALAAFLYGVSSEAIRGAVGTFGGLPHRLEHVCSGGGITYINDSKATTPESVITAVDALSGAYAVILGGSSKGVSYDGMATRLAQDSRLIAAVVMGATGPAIEEALRRAGLHQDRIVQAASLEEAVERGTNLMVTGGTLLLSPACASFDMFRDFEERGDVFKAIVLRRCAAASQ